VTGHDDIGHAARAQPLDDKAAQESGAARDDNALAS
jgi:hypothetical protein